MSAVELQWWRLLALLAVCVVGSPIAWGLFLRARRQEPQIIEDADRLAQANRVRGKPALRVIQGGRGRAA